MKQAIFTCKVLTPMFLNGADGQTPEIRAPSIKGAIRFWWRALNGHLPLLDVLDKQEKGKVIVKGLKSLETEIFGGSGDTVQRSNVIIQVIPNGKLQTSTHELVPHKPFMKGDAFNPGSTFDVKLTLLKEIKGEKDILYFGLDHLKSIFMLSCYLGGLGKRVRRGMGSVDILNIDDKPENRPITLPLLLSLIENLSPFYQINGEKIVFNYSGRSPQYGYVTQIQLGKTYPDHYSVLKTISNATHITKEKYRFAYAPSMGHAFKGRYASPVYTSVIKGSVRPIITTLNLAPDRDANEARLSIQQDFKEQIL